VYICLLKITEMANANDEIGRRSRRGGGRAGVVLVFEIRMNAPGAGAAGSDWTYTAAFPIRTAAGQP
jgi:hypothetical protein